MKTMRRISCLVVPLILGTFSACVTAEQKQDSKWEVKATTASQQKVWITKSDGSRQCEGRKGALSPALAAQQLKQAGIMVFRAKTGTDGQMHAQKCGAATGATVDLEISRMDVRKALEFGFVTKSM